MPAKVKVPDADMYNVYSSGKKAEDVNAFVKQKTGFDVRSLFIISPLLVLLILTTCVCVL